MRAREHLKSLGVPLFEAEPGSRSRHLSLWQLRLLTVRKMISPRASDYMSDPMSYRAQWRQYAEQLRPDAFLLYTTEAVALAHGLFPDIPRLASLVDLDHEARELKRALRPPTLRNRLKNCAERLQDRLLPQTIIDLLKDCDVVVEHSAASSQWLNQNGASSYYLPNPIESQLLPDNWNISRKESLAAASAKRILMVGHLRGVATQSGLHLLADEVLPALDRKLPSENWEVHIVGGGELTSELKAKLSGHPRIKLRGFVENLFEEYKRAHLALVAVSEKLGFRTRLVEAFAHASPCVVHSNNLCGMPELESEYNSLLSDVGEGLADAIIRILSDDALRVRLEVNAKNTYDEKLSVPVVMNKMQKLLEASLDRSNRGGVDLQSAPDKNDRQ